MSDYRSNRTSLCIFVIFTLLFIYVAVQNEGEKDLILDKKSNDFEKKPLDNTLLIYNSSDSHYISWNLKQFRKSALIAASKNREDLLKASYKADSLDFYKKVKMEAFCGNKVRIGEVGDGGKYVCNPEKVKENCVLMSLGLNNQIEYDEMIFKATGFNKNCTSLGADKNAQNRETQKKYSKINGQLFAGMIPNELPISKVLKESGRSEIELLKIDIEGGEFAGLEPIIRDYYVCQIFIEIHGSPAEHLKMLQIMARYGFRIFNIDPNPFCITCSEYSLINDLCMAQFEVVPLAINVPVPQD